MQKILLVFLSAFLLTGCVSSFENQMNSLNKDLKNSKSPTRFVKVASNDKYDKYSQEWAGTPGESVAFSSKILTDDIFNTIEKHCGLKREDLVETRVVSHKFPEFYEVWVFKDKLSKRNDGLSGLTVFMKQLPNNQGTDFLVTDTCHSSQMTYTFGK